MSGGLRPAALLGMVAPRASAPTAMAPPAACTLPTHMPPLLSARQPQVLEFVGADAQSYVHRPLPPAMQVGLGLGVGWGRGVA